MHVILLVLSCCGPFYFNVSANRGCPAVSITLEVGQEGYETMTTVNFPVTLPGNTANKKCPTDYEGNSNYP